MRKQVFILVFLLVQTFAFCQVDQVYRNLVMEGGGIKGVAYGGALKELEDRDIMSNITRVAGTSAGAIQATLVALGYSADEIPILCQKRPLKHLMMTGFLLKVLKG